MEKLLKNLVKSFFAGVAIALGALVYISVNGGLVGAALFSIGLYLVLWYGLNLYTGKVGYANSIKDVPDLLVTIIGNALGCTLSLIIPKSELVLTIIENKLNTPLWLVFIKAILCGILIYAGVDQYKKNKQYAPFLIVVVFILAGAEHCIANLCYFIAARTFTIETIIFTIITIIGNAVGSLAWRYLT